MERTAIQARKIFKIAVQAIMSRRKAPQLARITGNGKAFRPQDHVWPMS
jgi:hypothetical protein